jgi:hypothetical protein
MATSSTTSVKFVGMPYKFMTICLKTYISKNYKCVVVGFLAVCLGGRGACMMVMIMVYILW